MHLDHRRAEPQQLLVERRPVVVRPGVTGKQSRHAEDLGRGGVRREVDLVRRVRRHAHHELVEPHAVVGLALIQEVHVQLTGRQRCIAMGVRQDGSRQYLLVRQRGIRLVSK